MLDIRVKRVYEPAAPDDGERVLVDRLWPRGLTAEKVKEIAPSHELRRLFHHDLARWDEFRARYFAELDANPAVVQKLRDLATQGRLTLLFAAKDAAYNQAVVLREYLLRANKSEE